MGWPFSKKPSTETALVQIQNADNEVDELKTGLKDKLKAPAEFARITATKIGVILSQLEKIDDYLKSLPDEEKEKIQASVLSVRKLCSSIAQNCTKMASAAKQRNAKEMAALGALIGRDVMALRRDYNTLKRLFSEHKEKFTSA